MAKRVGRATTQRSLSARIFTGVSPPLDDRIPIPPASSFNANLSSADEATMLRLLGVPGRKTENCSPATGAFKTRIQTANVGPFRVTGLNVAVDLLKAVFDEATQQIPDVVAAVKTAGMLCVRHKRHNPNSFSNHSWGTAIDLFFGKDVVPQGVHKTDRGCLLLAPFFNNHGWYWGAGFSGASVDSMHFELSKETIQREIHP
jgi:D-alanyl-D-alanine carboxypeptidase